MIKRWIGAVLALALPFGAAQGKQEAERPLAVRVAAEGWGDASPDDVAKVLVSAGESLTGAIPALRLPPIEVSRSTTHPIVLYERGPGGEIRVRLNVENRRWAQFAFQFGHEMGHIVCGYADYPNPNRWFEETVCEVASLFVLGRMAETWTTRPPYPNWKDYAGALRKYRDDRTAPAALPRGTTLAAWFREREASLRKDGTQRELNLTMAVAILPLFEEAPDRWGAMSTLNAVRGDASRTFRGYLQDWSRSAPEAHRAFIGKMAERFGVAIDR
jgi:hypothetical protein